MKFEIHIEGGGPGAAAVQFRKAWKKFLTAAGVEDRKFKVVRGGTRNDTFRNFLMSVRNSDSGFAQFLLIDSETPLNPIQSKWEHLERNDKWQRPKEAGEESVYMMVQVMESWFLADPDLLKSHFGRSFKERFIKKWPNLEDISKGEVLNILKMATKNCSQPYKNGPVSFEILSKIDPVRVEQSCKHAKQLLEKLRAI